MAENRRVDKSEYLEDVMVLNGTLRQESSIIDPVILLNIKNLNSYLYNYMYIEAFKRYYYINNIDSVRTNLWSITGHVDVLYTWGAQIKQNRAIIDGSSNMNDSNKYIDNSGLVMEARKFVKVIPFPSHLNDVGEYILITAGGSAN